MSGRSCKCGRTYADELVARDRKVTEKEYVPTKKPRKKKNEPKNKGEYFESYFYTTNKTDGE